MKKAIIITLLLSGSLLPLMLWFGEKDDAPGVALLGFIVVLSPIIFSSIKGAMNTKR